MKRVTLIVAAVLTLFGTVPAAQAQETLKIGAVVALSGAGAAWGDGMLNGAKLAADDVNSAGGLQVGDKKYKIAIVAYDDKYQANEAVTAANRLVYEDGVKYIVGPTGSAPLLAIQPITEKNKVIVLTLAFTAKTLGADKPYTFRPILTTSEFSQPQIDWVAKVKGVRKVGGLFPNDETGQQIAKDVDAAYQKAGAQLAGKEFFERDRVDFVPLLTRVLASGVGAIELDGNSPATAGLLVKQAREIGFPGLIVRTGGPATAEIIGVAGKRAAEGLYVHSVIDPRSERLARYIDRYQKTYKQPMNGFSPFFYDSTHMLFEAMKKAGTVTDTDKVKTVLERIQDYDGVLGKLSWTGKDKYGIAHQISAPFYIAQVTDGREIIVAHCNFSVCE